MSPDETHPVLVAAAAAIADGIPVDAPRLGLRAP
jgi:hypothetical protein